MPVFPRQTYSCPPGYHPDGYDDGECYRNRSSFDSWGRWVVAGIIIAGALFLFFIFACITSRRRRRQGITPYRGTGWAAGATPAGHGPAQYNNPQSYYGGGGAQYSNQPNGAPVYSPPANQGYYGNQAPQQGYFGGQQGGVELQQPNNSYQPQRGGDQVYSPPSGPPPAKDGIIR